MKKNTRDEFFNREGDQELDTVTIRFKNGTEYTLDACTPNTINPDGLFIFVQSEEGVGVAGGGSPQFLDFIGKHIIPDMIGQRKGTPEKETNPMEQLMRMMAGLEGTKLN